MTQARTSIDVSWRNFLTTNIRGGLHYKKILWRHALFGEEHPFMEGYFDFSSRKQRGPLTQTEIDALVAYQERVVDADFASRSKEMDVSAEIDVSSVDSLSSRKKFTFILQEFLKTHDIQSVANIGARVDFYSAYLSSRFPSLDFYSMDFQRNLDIHNSLFPSRINWHFRSGYPLDLIRRGAVNADMYFFVSASILMNNKGLNVYLDEISKHARALAFCEGWWPRAERLTLQIERPECIPKENPYCPGDYANYHHNYIAKLEERGFRIESSRIVPEAAGYHYLQLFALKR